MKKPIAPTSAVLIGAPEFLVIVRVPAFTRSQAERLEAQVAHMFTGYEVEIVPVKKPEPAPVADPRAGSGAATAARAETGAAVDKFAGALLEQKVPETKVAAALGALLTPAAPAAAAVAAGAPDVARPFAVDDVLEDVHVPGRVVTVAGADAKAFYFDDGSSCAWESAECYQKVSARATSTRAESGAATSAKSTPAKKARPGAPRDRADLAAGVKPRQPRAKMIGAHKPAAKH